MNEKDWIDFTPEERNRIAELCCTLNGHLAEVERKLLTLRNLDPKSAWVLGRWIERLLDLTKN